ncbi:MAG: restriction endonuclease [Caldisericia bacterium]|nr:restriction endonuclease [Caldisericia bacterium]
MFKLIETAKYPGNLFLKHLVVLSNYGGESIQRLERSFADIFPKDKMGGFYFEFIWQSKTHKYVFEELPKKGLNNKVLAIDGAGLSSTRKLDGLTRDIIAILLFASTSNISNQAGLESCEIGTLLGNESELKNFVKQRYIIVSRITGGATANSLGQLAQTAIVDFLHVDLGNSFNVVRNGYLKLKDYKNKSGMPFDIVVSKNKKSIGIEVSFQVTTNSTIERKAGQAADRYNLMHKGGYKIAYVLDGAGNFQRSSALATICNNSDCTVAYTVKEFKVLANWIKSELL